MIDIRLIKFLCDNFKKMDYILKFIKLSKKKRQMRKKEPKEKLLMRIKEVMEEQQCSFEFAFRRFVEDKYGSKGSGRKKKL